MKSQQIGIRMTPELKARLEKLAAAEDRTLSQYVLRLILAALPPENAEPKKRK